MAKEQQAAQSSRPPEKSSSRLALGLTFILIPTVLSGAFVYPFVAVLSVVPFIGVVALPSLLGLTAFLIYGSAWLVYLLLAQDDLPTGVSGVFLPWSPLRCLKVDRVLLSKCRSMIQLGIPQLALDWCYRRIMVTGGRNGKKIVRENILYGSDFPGRRLDVYMPDIDPILDTSQPRDVQDPKEEGEDGGVGRELAPVLVLFGGGAWTFGNRRTYMQLALRFRRLGYVVVLPDLTTFPEARCKEMVCDMRKVLAWTHQHIARYGGDPDQIYLCGHGSGAHLSLLTVVQEAVVRSRDDYWLRAFERADSQEEADVQISAGIRRLEIWGEEEALPTIAGMILISGVYDVIKQIRYESKLGIEHVSPLRRALGPTHALSLMASPSHLIYGSKQLIDPNRLPQKFLLLHGGADTDVPIVQTILLKTLLVGIDVPNVKLRAYRHLSHLEAVTAMMLGSPKSQYGPLLISEIRAFIGRP